MPKINVDYSKTVIYKIVCNDLNITDCYVGSTTNFTKRKNKHKTCCNNQNDKKYIFKVYKYIRDNGGWDNWSMVLIENYPCLDHLEACRRERFWIETLKSTLNTNIPLREKGESNKIYYEQNKEMKKEYYEKNKDKKKEYYEMYKDRRKINLEANKEKIKERQRQYYEKNKDKIKQKYQEKREKNKNHQEHVSSTLDIN